MKPPPPAASLPSQESLKAISYDDTTAAKAPIPITVAKSPAIISSKSLPRLRKPMSSSQRLSPQVARSKLHDDVRRDSGLAPSCSTARDSRTTLGTDVESTLSIRHSPSSPSISVHDETQFLQSSSSVEGERIQSSEEPNAPHPTQQAPFMSILTEIPTGSFEDLTIPGQVEFSKRGSMLIGGKKANKASGEPLSPGRAIGSRRQPNGSALAPPPIVPKRILSANDEALSQKVRLLYEGIIGRDTNQATRTSKILENSIIEEKVKQPSLMVPSHAQNAPEIITNGDVSDRAPTCNGSARSTSDCALLQEQTELAGGIEDWEDLNGGDVDRYGFIVPRTDQIRQSPHGYNACRHYYSSHRIPLGGSAAPSGSRTRVQRGLRKHAQRQVQPRRLYVLCPHRAPTEQSMARSQGCAPQPIDYPTTKTDVVSMKQEIC